MSIELLYFSELSKICQGLKLRKDKTDLSNAFGIKDDLVFCSWLHTLSYIRNICAHHSRLWNISLDITPMVYFNKNASKVWLSDAEVKIAQRSKLYYTLCIILYLLQTVNSKTKFREHFKELVSKYPIVNISHMGFPPDWEGLPLWQN